MMAEVGRGKYFLSSIRKEFLIGSFPSFVFNVGVWSRAQLQQTEISMH